jgi:hypothetical protein
MEHEPYEGGVCIFSCAKQETAIYLRDWCEAIEENRCRTIAKDKGWVWPNFSFNKTVYEIEESEVIL